MSNSQKSTPLWFFAFTPYKIGETLFINILPLFVVQVIGGNITDISKISSITSLAGVIGFTFWGNLSDKTQRRLPFLIIGIIGFCICTMLFSLEKNVNQVIKFCAINGFFMAAITPTSTALVLDYIPQKDLPHFFGRFYLLSGWSFVVAIFLGIIWLPIASNLFNSNLAMRSLLILAAASGVISFILCLVWVKEPHKTNKNREYNSELLGELSPAVIERRLTVYSSRSIYFILSPQIFNNIKTKITNPLTIYYCCSILLFFSIQLFVLPFPIFLTQVFGATNSQVLFIILMKSLVEVFLYIPIGKVIHKENSIKVQSIAISLRIIIFGFLSLLAKYQPINGGLIIIGLLHILTGITWDLISLSSTISVAFLAPKGQEGTALGVYNSIIGIATILGSLFSGYIVITKGYSICFMLAAILAGIAGICLWFLAKNLVSTDTLENEI